jgi:hypothetical protein
MAEKKSIYEEALLDIKKIQEALNANTKEILRSVAREEIDSIVKESLEEDDYEEEDIESTDDNTESDSDISDDSNSDDSIEDVSDETETTDDDINVSDSTQIQTPEVDLDGQEDSMDADDASVGDELDMTSASDDDVIAIYKKLSGNDEIEIVGDEIHMNIQEPGEYIVKKGALTPNNDVDIDASLGNDSDSSLESTEDETMEDEMTYEIEMEGDEDEDEELPPPPPDNYMDNVVCEDEDNEMVAEVEADTDEDVVEEKIKSGIGKSVGSHSNLPDIQTKGAGVQTESVNSKKVISETEVKYSKLLTEATQLKTENEQFRNALKKFKNMLVETVVFNANLSYITKLFVEHATTKDEKKGIITRFDDEVTNLKESKKLFKTIVTELTTRTPINESIDNKITKGITSGSSKQLNEATAYVDPSTQRIKDLIARVENKDKY